MATNLDLTPWRESPRGVGYRRWAIVATGLRDLFRAKLPMLLLTVGWSGGVLLAIVGFLLTQSISSGGWLETLASNFGARAEATVTAESLQPVSGALELPLFPEDDLPESTSASPAAGTATKAPASKAPAAKAVETGHADFDAALQRMSVICRRNDQRKIYCKGSPEVMRGLCAGDVPEPIYSKYAKEGYRVIACGGKILDPTGPTE